MGGISGALWRSDEGRGPDDEDVTVDALSWNPSAAYRVHHGADGARGRSCLRVVAPTPHATPRPEGHTRFVCVSDTHSLTDCLRVPPGDVLLHTGDFTRIGLPLEVSAFNDWLGRQPCQHKVVIAGNHELSFDADFVASLDDPWRYFGIPATAGRADVTIPRHVRSLLTNGVYLQDGETEVLGFRIYGSPWQPEFCNWAFTLPRGERLLEKWQQVPAGVDVLLTHGPPLGAGDRIKGHAELRAGCVELMSSVRRRVKPRLHSFGHIHEGYGIMTDGRTLFVNASTCNVNYEPVNPPIIIDLPNP
ncbi:metallophosphoesterase MPPED2-like isoform X1 [Petromyzon marinus]|uniref:metallophosphoesterase MPPED2-like isoform X1 n=1 Tax=Petromyzon marinus TaxID=7757 RepID=UPI003F6F62EF